MKIAICLRGAISKIGGAFTTYNNFKSQASYINYQACYNSTVKHILEANSDCHFDFFIHSWNPDLQSNLIKLYNPKGFLFENNDLYKEEINTKIKTPNDYGGISASLSMKKSIELLNDNYDLIILYRPDVLLMQDIDFSLYHQDKIYVNGALGPDGWTNDFHFIMNVDNIMKFKSLYDSIELGNHHNTHYWINNFVKNIMGKKLTPDTIQPGLHQEVLRKVYSTTIKHFNVPMENLLQYGLTKEEILLYSA